MARNGSGTFSITNSFSSGATISASAMNANFSDVGAEITNSLPRDGQAAMTGPLKASSGTAAAPGLTFGSDTDTGFYRKSSDTIGVAVGGTEVGEFSSKGTSFIPAGVILPYGATTAPTGWVRANGRTIGNAASSASERANADTETLYAFLWNNYSDSVCAVSTGRGATAAIDYAANKTITLPDLRGRGFFGLDDMGNTPAARIGTVLTTPTTNGTTGGTETVTLSSSEMPAHTHDLSSHTHSVSGTSGSAATDHSHGVGTYANSAEGGHSHTYSSTTGTQSADHTHGVGTLATNTTGAHTHSYTAPASGVGGDGGASVIEASTGGTTSSNGDHSHTISGATATQSASHTHAVSGTTDAVSTHTHTISGTSATDTASHTHSFSATSGTPSNNTSGSTGSTSAHSNMPPAFLGTWIIKL